MSRRGKRRKGQPTAIGDIVGQVLGDLGLDAVARAQRIGVIWESAVGAQVAAHCRPLGMRDDVLELEVDSPVWSQQLQLRTPELLAALEQAVGSGAPRELHFQVGYARARPLAAGRGADPRIGRGGMNPGRTSSRGE